MLLVFTSFVENPNIDCWTTELGCLSDLGRMLWTIPRLVAPSIQQNLIRKGRKLMGVCWGTVATIRSHPRRRRPVTHDILQPLLPRFCFSSQLTLLLPQRSPSYIRRTTYTERLHQILKEVCAAEFRGEAMGGHGAEKEVVGRDDAALWKARGNY